MLDLETLCFLQWVCSDLFFKSQIPSQISELFTRIKVQRYSKMTELPWFCPFPNLNLNLNPEATIVHYISRYTIGCFLVADYLLDRYSRTESWITRLFCSGFWVSILMWKTIAVFGLLLRVGYDIGSYRTLEKGQARRMTRATCRVLSHMKPVVTLPLFFAASFSTSKGSNVKRTEVDSIASSPRSSFSER